MKTSVTFDELVSALALDMYKSRGMVSYRGLEIFKSQEEICGENPDGVSFNFTNHEGVVFTFTLTGTNMPEVRGVRASGARLVELLASEAVSQELRNAISAWTTQVADLVEGK